MDLMRKIIITSCILSVVITAVDCIKPSEKFSSQLKSIFSLIFIIGIVTAGIKTGIDFELPEYESKEYDEGYAELQKTADEAMKKEMEYRIGSSIEKLLSEKNISFEKVYVNVNINDDGGIDINRIDYKGKDFEQARKEIEKNFTDAEVTVSE